MLFLDLKKKLNKQILTETQNPPKPNVGTSSRGRTISPSTRLSLNPNPNPDPKFEPEPELRPEEGHQTAHATAFVAPLNVGATYPPLPLPPLLLLLPPPPLAPAPPPALAPAPLPLELPNPLKLDPNRFNPPVAPVAADPLVVPTEARDDVVELTRDNAIGFRFKFRFKFKFKFKFKLRREEEEKSDEAGAGLGTAALTAREASAGEEASNGPP